MSYLDWLEKLSVDAQEHGASHMALLEELKPALVLDLIARVKAAEAERDAYKARLDAVRATVEYEKHWNDGYGWDVATIRVLAALDGDPTG